VERAEDIASLVQRRCAQVLRETNSKLYRHNLRCRITYGVEASNWLTEGYRATRTDKTILQEKKLPMTKPKPI
jgi:hypothetical protein